MLAVFTVDNLGDAGPGSLRQPIEHANAGADTIEFQPGLPGTMALSTGELTPMSVIVEGSEMMARRDPRR